MAFSKEMYLKTSATAGQERWKGHLTRRNLDAFQKPYQNRIQKFINPKLYERDKFSAEKNQSQERPTR